MPYDITQTLQFTNKSTLVYILIQGGVNKNLQY